MGGLAITVWRFDDAPAEYKRLSPHGGDEDWLARVPRRFCVNWPALTDYDVPAWLWEGTPFGVCDVSVHTLDGDSACIVIGAHA